MAHVKWWQGPAALSDATRTKLERKISEATGSPSAVYAEFFYVAFISGELASTAAERLEAILAEPQIFNKQEQSTVADYVVVPRLGTISPWSSKATDIVKLCGIDGVERVERGTRWWISSRLNQHIELIHDRMTESVIRETDIADLGLQGNPRPLIEVELGNEPSKSLADYSRVNGLALSSEEIEYLVENYEKLERNPTDVELFMFAQANSEHCRHKIFNATWLRDAKGTTVSLFQRIRRTTEQIQSRNIVSAYSDNAAVIEGFGKRELQVEAGSNEYRTAETDLTILMKVETHNHPTAISPFAGAATGSGGEIRDEGAVGRGSKPKAGLVGYTTSHLRIPGDPLPWEDEALAPDHIASPLEIMLDGPIGGASFNNEFGRPCLTGYFRTFEHQRGHSSRWGYHKPVMIAGGLGTVDRFNVHQANDTTADMLVVILGGPGMLIGLGGGAASSQSSSSEQLELDFASVQRGNPEIQRRCQEVIDRCSYLNEKSPIALIHDVGAGGLSNAVPELVHELEQGASIDLDAVTVADPMLSPMEIWVNESQERYALAAFPDRIGLFEEICRRERCPFDVIGSTDDTGKLVVHSRKTGDVDVVDLKLETILGRTPRTQMSFTSNNSTRKNCELPTKSVEEVLHRVLRHPSVGSKKFLVTIGDRSITGSVAQEQMIGSHQVPVADAAVTISSLKAMEGEVMAVGERSPIGILDPAASVRLAIAEALTNLAGVSIRQLGDVVLSANWMAAPKADGEAQALFEGVSAASEFCCGLGIAIPVGKDSLSMQTKWDADGVSSEVISPLTLIASAFAPVPDVTKVLTPALTATKSKLVLLAPSKATRLGGSIAQQVFNQIGGESPDVSPDEFARFFNAVQQLHSKDLIRSIHDRSDGGVLVALLEMAFAGNIGFSIGLDVDDPISFLLSEEIGVVAEVSNDDLSVVVAHAKSASVTCVELGFTNESQQVDLANRKHLLFRDTLVELEKIWSSTSFELQKLRDNPVCAQSEFDGIAKKSTGLTEALTFEIPDEWAKPLVHSKQPRIAILREQGVNGQREMAGAFLTAGFECIDVHMTDIFEGRVDLDSFQVMAMCGGFSYGDVLGGGGGWAKSILFNEEVRATFARFFERDTLTLAVCNGCQAITQLSELIPAASNWPRFVKNHSEQFEGRTVQVRIKASSSPWLANMANSRLVVPVAHGEGRVAFQSDDQTVELASTKSGVCMEYVDATGEPTETYPWNPNGSIAGIAAVTSEDGRVLAMMPHPERQYRSVQQTWRPPHSRTQGLGAWAKLFRNAYEVFA